MRKECKAMVPDREALETELKCLMALRSNGSSMARSGSSTANSTNITEVGCTRGGRRPAIASGVPSASVHNQVSPDHSDKGAQIGIMAGRSRLGSTVRITFTKIMRLVQ